MSLEISKILFSKKKLTLKFGFTFVRICRKTNKQREQKQLKPKTIIHKGKFYELISSKKVFD